MGESEYNMNVTLRREGKYAKKVVFDSELVGFIDKLSPGRYQVWSLKQHGYKRDSSCVVSTFNEALAMFTNIDWRSVCGRNALNVSHIRHYEPKRPDLTKPRWARV